MVSLPDPSLPLQTLPVLTAEAFRVREGANAGDPLGIAPDLTLDDIYEVAADSPRVLLSLADTGHGPLTIAAGSAAGQPGHALYPDCAITLMAPDGTTFDAVILAEVDPEDSALITTYLLPMAGLAPKQDYQLVGIAPEAARARLAEVACVSFARGTRIALADGRQCPIEDLQPGDRVLTRNNGPQELRWIGQTTQRAVGDLAPIVIRRGVLNNESDLVVSPNHRLFIYQRQDRVGAGRAELLVRARDLVNGDTVYRQNGGFVDYFQLLFDAHQIIYAEGIAAESLLLDRQTSPALPEELAARMANILPGHGDDSRHREIELPGDLLEGGDPVERLRRASSGRPDGDDE